PRRAPSRAPGRAAGGAPPPCGGRGGAGGGPGAPAGDLGGGGGPLPAPGGAPPPYDHETAMATLSALVTSEPDPPARAGPLRPILEGLLVKDPERRLSAARAAEMLAAVTAPAPPVQQPARPKKCPGPSMTTRPS